MMLRDCSAPAVPGRKGLRTRAQGQVGWPEHWRVLAERERYV